MLFLLAGKALQIFNDSEKMILHCFFELQAIEHKATINLDLQSPVEFEAILSQDKSKHGLF